MPKSSSRIKIGIVAYVPSQYSVSYEKGGGGWLRFQKILERSNKQDIKYHLVEFKLELQNHLVFGAFLILFSMILALIHTTGIIKRGNVHLILSPLEIPQPIILAYLSSKITRRISVAFLNSVPCYGSIEVSTLKRVDEKISYNSLFRVIRSIRKSVVRAILEAFIWYVAFRVLSSPSTHVICLSPVIANELSDLGIKGRMFNLYPGNGIDYNEISSVTLKINENKYDAIYAAGSFHPQKGVFDVVEIWGHVVKKRPSAKLAIAGRVHHRYPSIIKELNHLIQSLGLDKNVTMANNLLEGMTQRNLWKEMKRSKIFLYPSRKDVWSLVIGEALACGLPVIAYDLPGIKYAYGDCPAVCLQNVGDVEGAAKTMIRLLSDDSLLRNLSHKARQYAENHSWTHVVELERKAYLAILES
jgi:glycosyltransferase involved in cell wall biosynthesis